MSSTFSGFLLLSESMQVGGLTTLDKEIASILIAFWESPDLEATRFFGSLRHCLTILI